MTQSLLWTIAALLGMAAEPRQDPPAPQPPPAELAPPRFDAQDLALVRAEKEVQQARDEVRKELADTVANQKVAVSKAELAWKQALLARETREYDLKEYVQGIFPQDQESARGELALAEADFKRSQEYADANNRAKGAGQKINPRFVLAGDLELQRSKFTLQEAQTNLDVLEKYTKHQETKRRTALVTEATAEEMMKQSEYDLQRGQLDRRKNQAARLQARTPEDLVVALLGEVVEQETRVAALAREILDLNARMAKEPDRAGEILVEINEKRQEIRKLAEEIRDSLDTATAIGEDNRRLRQRLFFAEQNLVQIRRAHEARPN